MMSVRNTLCSKRVDLFDLIFLWQGLNHELEPVPGEILTFYILHWIQNGITDHENHSGHGDDGVWKS